MIHKRPKHLQIEPEGRHRQPCPLRLIQRLDTPLHLVWDSGLRCGERGESERERERERESENE
eukprot:83340-Amorphochlora_amoeboformis.AAC.1